MPLLFVTCAWPVAASEHPVPLDKGVTEAKCIECHQDKTRGKTVHPAVNMGCFACHVVRQSGGSTRINLKNARPSTLCFSCHDDKSPAKLKGHVHTPAQADCLSCHDPHTSDNASLLLKQTSGDAGENLCLSCHKQGVNVPAGGSRHAALDMGCNTCHVNHKVGERGKQEFDFHLTKATPALCVDCHDPNDKSLQQAHNNQPFGSADCVQCHDPHQSKSPKLLQAYVHAPFDPKGCDTCHQQPKDGKVVLTAEDSRALCLTCHEEVGKKMAAAPVQHPGAQGECVACHSPHAGKSARFLKPNGVAACTSCHSDKGEMQVKQASLHDPAFNQRCSICHEAHGGTRPQLVRENVDTLCLTCHAPDAKAVAAADTGDEVILGSVHVPAGYVAKAPRIDPRAGHPVPAHPLSGKDPRNNSKSLSCISCHNPHGGATKQMLVSADGSIRGLCQECHQQQQQKEPSK